MTVQGHATTLPVTMEHMVYHCACVARAVSRALTIGDLPFGSYQQGPAQAFAHAAQLMQAGMHMVKLEGGQPMVETVRFLAERGIPVCAHIGLTPQSVHQLGGFRVQGREPVAARQLHDDALRLEAAGASLMVLEAVPAALAGEIGRAVAIPTIGIGAGPDTDGQVLVLHDMLGLYPRPSPKFSKNFMAGAESIEAAVRAYVEAVRGRNFPGPEHSY
jgi:3-methyl-2-oxobutanoate hydroxymethyltransferase